jgi:hypothetical protein
VTGPRFRLGAEELIEMGRSKAPVGPNRKPFLSGRARRASMGAEELIEMGQGPSGGDEIDSLANAGEFLAGELAITLDVLESLTGVKVEEMAQGADVSFGAFSSLVASVPATADLLALILVAGAPFVKYGLTVPGLTLRGLGNVMAGAAKVLANRSLKDNQVSIDWAKKKIAADAPADAEGLRADVRMVLDASDVSGEDLAPRVDMETGKTTPEIAPEGAQA